MNSAPHLRIEDRPEFERVLDEALRTASQRPELAALGRRLSSEQLRDMAISASAAISACAAAEYQHFVALRERLRRPEQNGTSAASGGGGLAGGITESGGAGLFAALTVLVPVLAGTAAVIFLAVGYGLGVVSPEPSIAAPMRSVGWVFAALTAGGLLLASGGLLVTALRNSSSSIRAGAAGLAPDARTEEMGHARDAWREALLERGIVPFLRDSLDASPEPEPTSSAVVRASEEDREGRTPRLGYSHPGFSSPAGEDPDHHGTRPRYSSPDFSSPDYGGPEHPSH